MYTTPPTTRCRYSCRRDVLVPSKDVVVTPGYRSCALVVARSSSDLRAQVVQPWQHRNLESVLHGFISMDKKPAKNLTVTPAAAATGSAVKNGSGGKLPGLSRKLFQKGSSEPKKKALTEVKNSGNTRTLAMVLPFHVSLR
ncbi:hypothetical protein E2562_027692 [Oryza meyeriana var. granulata]|uniref:Uncharacterized protein n=1 Tax=Oryza meyeriana var. granulata TaxID=110450 RepID=A0A6G1CSD6_9ORYZ|nr:hypothetical protein E2562_027692 [Oryza meyeriana var. granulata]